LEEVCEALQPGDMIPSRAELMRRFDASERSVRSALDALERNGRIVRRPGAGTFIAESRPSTADALPRSISDSQTIVAITAPDHALFERAMGLLLRQATDADLSVVCRLIDPTSVALTIPRAEDADQPLGYIVFGRVLLPLAEQLYQAGNRTVLVGTPYADTAVWVPSVQGDQEHGGYLATRHLLELGHRRIAFLGLEDVEQTQRWRGHQKALKEARKRGIAVADTIIYQTEYDQWQNAPEVAKAFFAHPDAPTGIVVWNDHDAFPLLSLLSYIGLRVPRDVSVVGYDNLPEGQKVHPSLSTVDGAIETQLQAAIQLINRPVAPSPSHTVVVLPTMTPRDSTAAPQASL